MVRVLFVGCCSVLAWRKFDELLCPPLRGGRAWFSGRHSLELDGEGAGPSSFQGGKGSN